MTDTALKEAILALAVAAADRDALLAAIGFRPGPLGEGLSRKVILDDAGGLRAAMVAARREAERHEGDASLWWWSCEDGQRQPLLLRVWRQRRDIEQQVHTLTGELQRITGAAQILAGELSDPGTEALAAIYSAREKLRRLGFAPVMVAPLLDERMFWFLSILAAVGGSAGASDYGGEWTAAFCDDRRPVDTYNLCEDLGYTRTAHDDRDDSSTVRLTDLGREALALDSRSRAAP